VAENHPGGTYGFERVSIAIRACEENVVRSEIFSRAMYLNTSDDQKMF
jgi:hypothetical protein